MSKKITTAQEKLRYLTDELAEHHNIAVELHPKDGSFLIHFKNFALEVHPDNIHIGVITGEWLKYGPTEML